MSQFDLIKTNFGAPDYGLFAELPKVLYPENSSRFLMGHDPVEPFLEGLYVLLKNGNPCGRFAFYENPKLNYKGTPAACIGSYECANDSTISSALLDYAKNITTQKGYKYLIGPMEGSTWNNHRFSSNNDHPNFFMEPYHHKYYNKHFEDAGFSVISDYFSNLDQELNVDIDQLNKFEKIYLEKGASFRNLNTNDLESEFQKLAEFSLEAFSENFLFTPVSVSDFVTKYKAIAAYIDPKLVWIVENKSGEIEAFIFSVPDHFEATKPPSTLIIKSMARKKESSFRGIGSYLAGKTIQLAKDLGYTKVVHAFMIKDNASRAISDKYATDGGFYKNYALYGIAL